MRPNRKEYIVDDKPADCSECLRAGKCKKPCDKVERWINQDYVGSNSNVVLQNGSVSSGLHEYGDSNYNDWIDMMSISEPSLIGPGDIVADWDLWESVVNMRLTEKITRFIFSYYVLGMRIRDIAIMEKASSSAIDQRHVQSKKVIRRKLLLKSSWPEVRSKLKFRSISDYDVARLHFEYGYPRMAISKIVNTHVSGVGKRISRHVGGIQ